jgi:hypothetical protein
LIFRALLKRMKIQRSSGGYAYYRKHPPHIGISNRVSRETVDSRFRVLEKVEEGLLRAGTLEDYRIELGRSYYEIARAAYWVDSRTGAKCESRARQLAGRRAPFGTTAHKLVSALIGLRSKERLAGWIRERAGRR